MPGLPFTIAPFRPGTLFTCISLLLFLDMLIVSFTLLTKLVATSAKAHAAVIQKQILETSA